MRFDVDCARVAVLAALAVVGLGGASASATFDLSWYTIDGGGAMFSTGGNYSLGGTIGQHDAGVMSGGTFTLVGGFWALPTSPALCPGDMNCDGVVDFDDIDPFVAAIGTSCP